MATIKRFEDLEIWQLARKLNKEFIQYLAIAKASTAELSSQLFRLFDREKITELHFNNFQSELKTLKTILNKIGSFMNYLKKTEYKGVKFLREEEMIYGE